MSGGSAGVSSGGAGAGGDTGGGGAGPGGSGLGGSGPAPCPGQNPTGQACDVNADLMTCSYSEGSCCTLPVNCTGGIWQAGSQQCTTNPCPGVIPNDGDVCGCQAPSTCFYDACDGNKNDGFGSVATCSGNKWKVKTPGCTACGNGGCGIGQVCQTVTTTIGNSSGCKADPCSGDQSCSCAGCPAVTSCGSFSDNQLVCNGL
jgi:hypothetical protein